MSRDILAGATSADVVIVGGAAMGSSLAWHLLNDRDFDGRVVVIERDPTYARSASALSAASIRQQFTSPVNIKLSLYGIAFLREVGRHLVVDGDVPDVGLVERGYLYLATAAGEGILRDLSALQRAEGADMELIERDALAKRYPWLNVEDVTVGNWGRTGEGWFDGWSLLQAFRKAAKTRGAIFIDDEVAGIERDRHRIVAVVTRSGERIPCGTLVNCAGARGHEVAAMAGLDIPVRPKRRFVFTFHCRESLPAHPMLIDTTGTYARPEGHPTADGQLYICGASPAADADPDWDDRDPDGNPVDWSFFEETVWPALAHRVPAFEAIRPGRAWAGPYDMNLIDGNAIVGPAEGLGNFYLCNGFSGHGLQHCAGIGRGLAERIVHGRWLTLDLGALCHERVAAGRPLLERNII
jgi:FAD-dependent oxidoreductase domain-containing protein 1